PGRCSEKTAVYLPGLRCGPPAFRGSAGSGNTGTTMMFCGWPGRPAGEISAVVVFPPDFDTVARGWLGLVRPQHRLYFLRLPQGQGALRPTFVIDRAQAPTPYTKDRVTYRARWRACWLTQTRLHRTTLAARSRPSVCIYSVDEG